MVGGDISTFVGYNSLEVMIKLNPVQKAINIIENLSADKLYVALYILELIAASGEVDSQDILVLKAFEMTCEEEELSPSEIVAVAEGESELKDGMGVRAEDVWKKLGI